MNRLSKRIFDLLISLSIGVILLPVFVFIAVAIRLSSKGPAVFRQERAGKDVKALFSTSFVR